MNNRLFMKNDFLKFAVSGGINSNTLNDYTKHINGIINPTIVEERQLNAVTMDVFSKLISERIIVIGTDIDADVANIVTAQLMYLNSVDDTADIKLWINSPGGSVIDGLAIYDVMNWIKPDVATYCMGMAASMGSILVSSGEKGKRYILPHGQVMIHQVSSGARGVTADMEIAIKQAKKHQDELYRILATNTGKTPEEIAKFADRDCWFDAQEAVDFGLVDEIIRKSK